MEKPKTNSRGPKRKTPLEAGKMVTVTARLPPSLVMRLDEECKQLARTTGITTLNRSDLMRSLLERALALSAVLLVVQAIGGCAPGDAHPPTRLTVAVKQAPEAYAPVVLAATMDAATWWAEVGATVATADEGDVWLLLLTDDEWLSRYTSLRGEGTESPGDFCGAATACIRLRLSSFEPASSDQRANLVAHELGHAFGLSHVADLDAIMSPSMENHRQFGLTNADAAEWFRVHP